ncbi:hypothetical protein JCM19037_2975 [Geomicrobium sp. JCM 19037]|uniref:hypothetical protein n=1 Tax=unclassified Geomicrobium TaxID=2628951 RepID=UPI00045F228F|nr:MULTISPECIES: hypothetical protein [unclassified Geomicrobium]GAK04549.1 hypothetical protein JCM19037_2975 [Geomicrobium sp. JCM 19037]GAK10420.1 hypothetical protein JCM19039_28 [Geomicrobium sp. JCM 19039]
MKKISSSLFVLVLAISMLSGFSSMDGSLEDGVSTNSISVNDATPDDKADGED